MDDLITDFVCEAREMLQALEFELVSWEHAPDDRERLDAIFRFVHTIKGNCGFFDLPRLQALSHAAEDALQDVRAGNRPADAALVNAVLAVIDKIGELIAELEASNAIAAGDDSKLIAALAGDGAVLDGPETPADAGSNGEAAARPGAAARSVRVPVELLDRVMNGVSDMILARNEFERLLYEHYADYELGSSFSQLSNVLDDLRDVITQARMQPIGALFASYLRMARDLASELGKKVEVQIENGQVNLDREMVELIRDPLMHVIRNAIDHGIESPADRLAQGKPEVGLVRISARQTGNEIRIGVMDDGRGIDSERLVAKAVAAGILSAEAAERLTPRQRNALICEPGLSTARSITQISGRGVGMDVVRASIERIGGSLTIDSSRAAGSRILLSVPLTLSIVPTITVRVADRTFAIPRSYVDEIVTGSDQAPEIVGGKLHVSVRGQQRPCVGIAQVLGIENALDCAGWTLVMIKLINGDVFGLGVDAIVDHDELVVKPIAPEISGSGFYVGVAQLENGYPALMLDIAGIAREAGMIAEVQSRMIDTSAAAAEAESESQISSVLVFEGFDGVRRVVAMSAVVRLVELEPASISRNGSGPCIVYNDQILPLAGLAGQTAPADNLQVLILSDGERQVALAVAGGIDTAAIELSTATGRQGDRMALLNGEPVELVDCHRLFSATDENWTKSVPATCRLPENESWCRDFLRPLVEAAGYSVIDDDDAPVDLEIRLDKDAAADNAAPKAGKLLVVASRKGKKAAASGAIYRYDREALVEALDAARAGGKA